MPLWLVIIVLGTAGAGFAFMKARQIEGKATLKKVKEGHKSVKKAAKAVAAVPSTVITEPPLTSTEEIIMSQDMPSAIAKDLAAIMEKKDVE